MIDENGNTFKIIDELDPFEANDAEWHLMICETIGTGQRYGKFEFRMDESMEWTTDIQWHKYGKKTNDPVFSGFPMELKQFKEKNSERIDYAIRNGYSIEHLHEPIKEFERTVKSPIDF